MSANITFPELIQRTREELNSQIGLVNDYATELDNLRQADAPDPARVENIRSKRAAAEARIQAVRSKLEALQEASDDDDKLTRQAAISIPAAERIAPAVTNQRSRTYTQDNSDTFLRDLYDWSFNRTRPEQNERLLRHENEARATGQLSERAGTTGGFQGLVPPQYLLDQYALVARQGRPLANAVTHLDLPQTGMSLVIPRGTTGVTTAVQSTENSAVSNTDEVWTNLTVPVVTIAGQQLVSRQSVERAEGIQQILFADLMASYAVSLDQQVISGTGSSGQSLGVLNTSGVTQAAAFTAAATVATVYSKTAGAISAVQTSRYLAPDIIVMHPRRWNWLISQLDTTNRPLVTPDQNGPTNAYAVSTTPVDTSSADNVGSMLGLPVITDASIPINLGVGTLEDVIIVARKEDLLLWEEPSAPFQLAFEQTAGSNLTVTLVCYGYEAFTAGRFPTGVALVGGNAGTSGFGLTTVTF